MLSFEETYNQRKQELFDFLTLMEFFERQENEKNDEGLNGIDQFFGKSTTELMSFQKMINIFKSNVSLMLYSLVEFTVSNIMEEIYHEIVSDSLTYIEVSDNIKKIWRKSLLNPAKDPEANFSTFMKRNEIVVESIVENKTIELSSRDTMPGGNLDGTSIKDVCQRHGVLFDQSSVNFRPDLLSTLKNRRNKLAHGSDSFVEALRDKSVQEIRKEGGIITGFLDELIKSSEKYIKEKEYMA